MRVESIEPRIETVGGQLVDTFSKGSKDGKMSDCKTFNGVTEAVFECVKKTSFDQHKTVYDPPTANKGTATTEVPVVGKIVVSFDLDSTTGSITYCIVQKPWLVSASQIFGGIGDTINECLGKS